MNTSWDTLKILSDPTRLRLIALVMREELRGRAPGDPRHGAVPDLLTARAPSPGEPCGRPQDGKKAFYSLRPNLPAGESALLKAAVESVSALDVITEDARHLDRVLGKRRRVSEQYFNTIAGRLGRNHCPGRSWEAIGRLALRLVPTSSWPTSGRARA